MIIVNSNYRAVLGHWVLLLIYETGYPEMGLCLGTWWHPGFQGIALRCRLDKPDQGV